MSNTDHAEITFDLDEKLYPLEAVQNAVYVFTDRAYVRVERSEQKRLKVVMTVKTGGAPSVHRDLKGEFDNELMHQVLRQRISNSNQKIREFIVTKALVSAQPSALVAAAATVAAPSEGSCPDCVTESQPGAPAQVDESLEKEIDRLLAEIEKEGAESDPLGVSIPWEDKFGPKGDGGKEKAPAKGPSASKAKTPSKAKTSSKAKGS